jgi:peptidoglycan/LPS O-acetylase OafA/YrhL
VCSHCDCHDQTDSCLHEFAVTARDRVVRGDIEGLRALAVIAVLVNHAFPNALPGGFVGVDVFFVISGYLIGRHLLQDIQANRFSILGFYAKRARRIFPALALVLICVWGVGWLPFSAPEFSALGRQIVASAFFSNNIQLWSETGYFDVAALDKPLRHLWSLGIEEQFYLIVPTMLWLGSVGSAASVRWVARLGILSLLATIVLSNFDYAASFYLLHTRFWELAAGVVLAQTELRMRACRQLPSDNRHAFAGNAREVLAFCAATVFCCVVVLGSSEPHWEREDLIRDGGLFLAITVAMLAGLGMRRTTLQQSLLQKAAPLAKASSLVGIVLICASVLALSSTDWPGAQTLFPVLGTAMVIAAAPSTGLNKLLGSRPMVFIGGLSYPLYLWHWPVIVFWRLLNPAARGIEIAIPLIFSLALAWLTKTLLEEPVRFGRWGLVSFRRPHLALVVAGLALAAALGSIAVATQGLPSRFPRNLQAIATWSEISSGDHWRADQCYYGPQTPVEYANECTPAKRPGVPLVLLWGDSHAAHLYPGLKSVRSTRSFDIVQWTAAACPPTVRRFMQESPTCSARRATAWRKLTRLKPDTILLAGAWELYLERGESEADIVRAVEETIRQLKADGDKEIVVFGPGPTWNASLAIDLFRFMVLKRLNEIPERYGHPFEAAWHLDAAMAAQAQELGVRYVSVLNFFCNESGCRTVGDRSIPKPDLLYRDRDHLSATGSKDLIMHSDLHLF